MVLNGRLPETTARAVLPIFALEACCSGPPVNKANPR